MAHGRNLKREKREKATVKAKQLNRERKHRDHLRMKNYTENSGRVFLYAMANKDSAPSDTYATADYYEKTNFTVLAFYGYDGNVDVPEEVVTLNGAGLTIAEVLETYFPSYTATRVHIVAQEPFHGHLHDVVQVNLVHTKVLKNMSKQREQDFAEYLEQYHQIDGLPDKPYNCGCWSCTTQVAHTKDRAQEKQRLSYAQEAYNLTGDAQDY